MVTGGAQPSQPSASRTIDRVASATPKAEAGRAGMRDHQSKASRARPATLLELLSHARRRRSAPTPETNRTATAQQQPSAQATNTPRLPTDSVSTPNSK